MKNFLRKIQKKAKDEPLIMGMGALLFLVPLIFTPYTEDSYLLPKLTFLFPFGSFLFLLWITRGEGSRFSFFDLVFLVFLGVGALSLFKTNSLISSLRALGNLTLFIALYFVISHLIKNKEDFNFLNWIIIFSGVICALYGFLQYYGVDFPSLYYWGRGGGRGKAISTFGYVNFLAGYTGMVFPLTLGLFLKERGKKKLLLLFFLLLFVSVLMITRTRGAWLGVFFSLLILGFFILRHPHFRKFLKKRWTFALLLLVGGISILYLSPLEKRAEEPLKERILSPESIKQRFLLWRISLEMLKKNPFLGVGIGAFKTNFLEEEVAFLKEHPEKTPYAGEAKHSHNEYLQIGAELGGVGLSVFLLFLALVIFRTLRGIKRDKDPLLLGVLGSFVFFLTHIFFTFLLHLPAHSLLFFSLVGMVEGIVAPKKKVSLSKGRALLFGIFLFFLFFTSFLTLRSFYSSTFLKKGRILETQFKDKEAYKFYIKALRWDPFSGEGHFLLAEFYRRFGLYESALEEYKRALLYPEDINILATYSQSQIYYWLGWIYGRVGNYKEAEKWLKKILFLYPDHGPARYLLGVFYRNQGKVKDAKKELEKVYSSTRDHLLRERAEAILEGLKRKD